MGDAIQDSELGNRGWLSAFRLRKRFRKVLYASPERTNHLEFATRAAGT